MRKARCASFARLLAGVLIFGLLLSGGLVRRARAAELVMFERTGCPWCLRWNAEVAPGYPATSEGQAAPLRRFDIGNGQPGDVKLARPVRFTPTFVLVDEGREVGRITGYIDNGMFWGLFGQMLARLEETHRERHVSAGSASQMIRDGK